MFKKKGDWIRHYQIINVFPFHHGMLYYTEINHGNANGKETYFIHSVKPLQEPNPTWMARLTARNEDNFIPIKEAFVEEGLLYQVFERIEGVLLGIHIFQYAPMPIADVVQIIQKLTSALMECYDEEKFAFVSPENIVMNNQGQVKFLYGGPNGSLPHHENPEAIAGHDETEDVKELTKLILFMLTKEMPKLETGMIRIRQYRKDVPIELENLLIRSLSPDRSKRPRIQEIWKWAYGYAARKPLALAAEIDDSPAYLEVHAGKTEIMKGKQIRTFPSLSWKWGLGVVAGVGMIIWLITSFLQPNPADIASGIIDPNAEQNPDQALVYYTQSIDAYQKKNIDQAIDLGKKAVSANTNQKEFYQHLANLYGIKEDYKSGSKVLEAATSLFSDDDVLYNQWAVHAYSIKDYQQAQTAISKAIELKPNTALYEYHQGKILMAEKKYKEAIGFFQSAKQKEQTDGRYSYEEAIAEYNLGNLVKATNIIQKESLNSGEKNPLYNKFHAALIMKQREQMLQGNKTGSKGKESEKFLVQAGRSLVRIINDPDFKNSSDAQLNYYYTILNYYGYQLDRKKVDYYKAAMKHGNLAIKKDNKNPYHYYMMGLLFMEKDPSGKYDKIKAQQAFQKAISLKTDEPLFKQALDLANKLK